MELFCLIERSTSDELLSHEYIFLKNEKASVRILPGNLNLIHNLINSKYNLEHCGLPIYESAIRMMHKLTDDGVNVGPNTGIDITTGFRFPKILTVKTSSTNEDVMNQSFTGNKNEMEGYVQKNVYKAYYLNMHYDDIVSKIETFKDKIFRIYNEFVKTYLDYYVDKAPYQSESLNRYLYSIIFTSGRGLSSAKIYEGEYVKNAKIMFTYSLIIHELNAFLKRRSERVDESLDSILLLLKNLILRNNNTDHFARILKCQIDGTVNESDAIWQLLVNDVEQMFDKISDLPEDYWNRGYSSITTSPCGRYVTALDSQNRKSLLFVSTFNDASTCVEIYDQYYVSDVTILNFDYGLFKCLFKEERSNMMVIPDYTDGYHLKLTSEVDVFQMIMKSFKNMIVFVSRLAYYNKDQFLEFEKTDIGYLRKNYICLYYRDFLKNKVTNYFTNLLYLILNHTLIFDDEDSASTHEGEEQTQVDKTPTEDIERINVVLEKIRAKLCVWIDEIIASFEVINVNKKKKTIELIDTQRRDHYLVQVARMHYRDIMEVINVEDF